MHPVEHPGPYYAGDKYLVSEVDYDGDYPVGVFDTPDAANEYIRHHPPADYGDLFVSQIPYYIEMKENTN